MIHELRLWLTKRSRKVNIYGFYVNIVPILVNQIMDVEKLR